MIDVKKITKRLNKYILTIKISDLPVTTGPDLNLRVWELSNDSGVICDPVIGTTSLDSCGSDMREVKLTLNLTGFMRPVKLKVGVVKEHVTWLDLTKILIEN